MASTINADNGVVSGTSGLKSTADTSGVLALQSNGSTALSISTGLVTTLTNPLPVGSGGTGIATTPTAGAVPYGNGTTLAYTAAGTSGQFLTSNGSSAPTWTTVATPSTAGGATVTNPMSANITLTSSSNRVQLMTPSAWGYTITLPDATTISAAGGPIFILKNTTKYYPIKVLDSAGTNVAWVVSDYDTEIFLTSTASATGNWVIETHNPCANGGIYPYDCDANLVVQQIASEFTQSVGLSATVGMMNAGSPSGGNTRYYSTVSLQQTTNRYRTQTSTTTAGQGPYNGTSFLLRLSDTSTLQLYNSGSNQLYGRINTWTSTGGGVTQGSNTLISSSLDSGISAALLTSSTALVMWTDTGAALRTMVISFSGTAITTNTSYATSTTAGSSNSSLIGLQTSTLATVLSQNDGGVWIANISGTTITYPSAITISGTTSIWGIFALSATTSVVIYQSTGGNVSGVVITNDGTNISAGTATLLLSVGDTSQQFAISQLNVGLGLIVPTYKRANEVDQAYFIVAVSGGVPYIKSQGVLPRTSDMYTYLSPNSGACLIPTTAGVAMTTGVLGYSQNAKKAVIVGAA
jgi:hypothetical protein